MSNVWEKIADPNRTFIVAEAGVNHNGNLDIALDMIDHAFDCGCDAVKFQSFLANETMPVTSPKYKILKDLEMSEEWHTSLKKHADEMGIIFFSTAVCDTSVRWMEDLKAEDNYGAVRPIPVELYKIPSPGVTNIPMIDMIGRLNKPVILSTGMATVEEIQDAVEAFLGTGNTQLCLLHCVSLYPTPAYTTNLKMIGTLKKMFPDVLVGFSDHTEGIDVSVWAVAAGAAVIEKHFTLNRLNEGPDHFFSIEPRELLLLVRGIRKVEESMGSGVKEVSMGEAEKRKEFFRTLHSADFIKRGAVIEAKHVKIMCPDDGFSPKYYRRVIGGKAKVGIPLGAALTDGNVEMVKE